MSAIDGFMLVNLLVWPLITTWTLDTGLKRAVAAGIPGARRREYCRAISDYWLSCALAAAAAFDGGRSLEELRLLPPSGWGLLISAGVAAAAIAFLALQARSLNAPEARGLRAQAG